jgi:tRNA A-37 threonylcarbamoyl transferase component Bud32
MSDLFLETERPAVERALRAAFGTAELDTAVPMTGGLSGAKVLKIRVGGIAYLLRIETARDAFRDPARSYACMKIAADGLLAPRLRHADAESGVAIMDFIDERSLSLDYHGAREDLIVEAAQAARALHAGPVFPALVDYLDGMDALIGRFQARGLVAPGATAELFERYGLLRSGYRTAPGDLVASHNDLNPRNILYDGARLWFVDWESAFLADRYVDLSCLANLFAHTQAEEDLLLATYFGRADEEKRARLYLMRQVNHLFYGLVMADGVAAATPSAPNLEGPSLAQVHDALTFGDFELGSDEGRMTYIKARLAQALAGLRSPRFKAALAAVQT